MILQPSVTTLHITATLKAFFVKVGINGSQIIEPFCLSLSLSLLFPTIRINSFFSVFYQKQYQQMVTPSSFVLFHSVIVLHFNNDNHISVSSLATFIILTSFSTILHRRMYLLDETKSSAGISTAVDGFSHAVLRNWIFLLQSK